MQSNVRHTKCSTFEQQTFVEGLSAVHAVRGDFLFTSPLSSKMIKAGLETLPICLDSMDLMDSINLVGASRLPKRAKWRERQCSTGHKTAGELGTDVDII